MNTSSCACSWPASGWLRKKMTTASTSWLLFTPSGRQCPGLPCSSRISAAPAATPVTYPAQIPELLRGGSTLFLIWVSIQVVTYIDIFIVGTFTDATEVGYYSRAYWIVFLIPTIVWPRPLTAALVEYSRDPNRFADAVRHSTV